MPAYCTLNDLVARFGAEIAGVSDRDGDGQPDAAVVTKAIGTATSRIDSYIGTRYALPLVTVPPVIQTACEDLARAELYTTEIPDAVKEQRAATIRWLQDIAKGTASLDVPAPPAADASQSGTGTLIKFSPGDRNVSRAELRKL